MRVRVETGEERDGVDFELKQVAMGSIEGIVTGSAGLSLVQVTLIPSGPPVTTSILSSNSLSGRGLDAEGRFRYANLPPGRYRLVARGTRDSSTETLPSVVDGKVIRMVDGQPAPPKPAPVDHWYGYADVDLNGNEVNGVTLALQPGAAISGRIEFRGADATPRPADMTKARVTVRLETGGGMVSTNGLMMGAGLITSIATAGADGAFQIRGIGPGRFVLSAIGVDTAIWTLRSARAGDRDLLDYPFDLTPGIDLRDVVVTFSDTRTKLSGTLQTETGQLTSDYHIVVVPADADLRRPQSRRILSVRPGTDGRFVFVNPPAGDYLIAALVDLDPIDLFDADFLEQIALSGVRVTIAEGEKAVQDLRIR